MAKKIDEGAMLPGKKYKGYGFLNEAHEFCFTPEDTGSREGVIKHLTEKNGASVSYSKQFVFCRLKLKRTAQKSSMLADLAKQYNNLVKILLEYDF